MKSLSTTFFFILALTMAIYSHAQLTVQSSDLIPGGPDGIVENVFLGDGVQIMNITYSGLNTSIGQFDNAGSILGINKGIVLSTGNIEDISLDNDDGIPLSGYTSGTTLEDRDLETLAGVEVVDIASIEIEFQPSSDILEFNYVFASEEYPDFVCGGRNDVFGFFISGPRPGGGTYTSENIALIPDPNQAGGFLTLPVTINSVNNGIPGDLAGGLCDGPNESLDYATYYNSVPSGQQPALNAYLDVFVAQAEVVPCETYTIKIAIGDGQDQNEDSSVFLEEKSFSSGSVEVVLNNPGINGGLAEACLDGSINFSIRRPAVADFPIEIVVLTDSSLPNVALPGIDFEDFATINAIPEGQTTLDIPIIPIADNLEEGTEYIYLSIRKSTCQLDTLVIPLFDNNLKLAETRDSIVSCIDTRFRLLATIDGELVITNNSIFENDSLKTISPTDPNLTSQIIVTGLDDIPLRPNVIAYICIDTLTHPRLTDLDIYIEAPSGKILELSTDNGYKVNDDADEEMMINTCFTINSNQNINNGNVVEGPLYPANPSYTGFYLPEGGFTDWLNPTSPISDGTYTLYINDDTKEYQGALTGWQIAFKPAYELKYNWSPRAGIRCPSCPSTLADPTMSQYYYLEISDSYGCTYMDSTWVEVIDLAETPSPDCDRSEEGQLTFTWNNTNNSSYYEFAIVGHSDWIPTTTIETRSAGIYPVDIISPNQITVRGLLSNEVLNVAVRGNNVNRCASIPDTIDCQAPFCSSLIPVIEDIVVTQPDCPELLFAPVEVIATLPNGSTEMEYRIRTNTNTPFNFTGQFSAIPVGTWPLRIVALNGCTLLDSVTVLPPPSIEIVQEINLPKCHNDTNGSINVNISGDSGPYEVKWDDGSESVSYENLSAGDYRLIVTDATNCTVERQYEITNPDTLTYTYQQSDSLNCNNTNNVEASLDINGGYLPYEILWNGTTVSHTLPNLMQGQVTFEIIDSLGCQILDTIEVWKVDSIDVDFVMIQDVICWGDSGSATAIPSRGTGPYNYAWDSGEQDPTANQLMAGLNGLTITDSEGCTLETGLTLSIPQEIIIDADITDSSCPSAEDGSITLTINRAIEPYTLSWDNDNGSSEQSLMGIASGRYCVELIDDNGCRVDTCFNVEAMTNITGTGMPIGESCSPGNDGSITLTPSGGSGSYSYSWTGPAGYTSVNQNLDNLSSGLYTIIISDSQVSECRSLPIEITVDEPKMLEGHVDIITEIDCNGNNNGALAAIVDDGQPPYRYTWSSNVANFTEENADNLGAGQYTVIIQDANNCSVTLDIELTEPEALSVVFDSRNVTCFEAQDGRINTDVNGGSPPYTYLWSNGEDIDQIKNLAAGTYELTLTDARDCVMVLEENISSPTGPINLFQNIIDPSCFGGSNGSIIYSAIDGTYPYLYSFDGGSFVTDSLFTNLSSGNYVLTVRDANGCEALFESEVGIPEELGMDLPQEVVVNYNQGTSLEANPNLFEGLTFLWKGPFLELFSCTDCSGPRIDNITKSFSTSVYITDALGCANEVFVNINVIDDGEIAIPTAFSPNGDGNNDRLIVFGDTGIIVDEFKVYSRWGEKVYEGVDIVPNSIKGWDGTFNNKKMAKGTYSWTAKYTCVSGKVEYSQGQTILLR